MGSMAATIFVIDDEAEIRNSLGRLLRSMGFNVVAHESAQAFLAQATPNLDTGCILLDVDMPEMTGPQLHDRLADLGISLPVIYLTGQGNVSIGIAAMKKGASDFLEKPPNVETLLPAIERALAAHGRLQTKQRRMAEIEKKFSVLSRREREVMSLVITGLLNKQIADRMGIAEKTAKLHRSRMMEKLECRSVAALVHLCDEHQFGLGLAE